MIDTGTGTSTSVIGGIRNDALDAAAAHATAARWLLVINRCLHLPPGTRCV